MIDNHAKNRIELLEKAAHTSGYFVYSFCMSCGKPVHEGRCAGPPGPPAVPVHCPFCGVTRGANQICCETQGFIAESWIARRELETWAKANAVELAAFVEAVRTWRYLPAGTVNERRVSEAMRAMFDAMDELGR